MLNQMLLGWSVREDETGMACRHGRDEKCIQNFDQKIWREETIWHCLRWLL